MPKPQALVTFLTVLFALLITTHVVIGFTPIPSAALSLVLSAALAWIVNTRIPDDEAGLDDDITEEAEAERPQPE